MGRYNQSVCVGGSEDDINNEKLLQSPEFLKTVNGFIVISTNLSASVNNRYYGIASVTVTLPSVAENGDSVTFYREVGTEMTINAPNSNTILTSKGEYETVIIDVPEEVIFSYSLGKWMVL